MYKSLSDANPVKAGLFQSVNDDPAGSAVITSDIDGQSCQMRRRFRSADFGIVRLTPERRVQYERYSGDFSGMVQLIPKIRHQPARTTARTLFFRPLKVVFPHSFPLFLNNQYTRPSA